MDENAKRSWQKLNSKERVIYTRSAPGLERRMFIYADLLNEEQKAKLEQAEALLLEIADSATEETNRTLKGDAR